MASWDDVRRIVAALPEVDEDGRGWRVRKKPVVWERPLRTADLAALGESAPTGPILAARVADTGEKDVLIASHPEAFFTTPHFDGYRTILMRLDHISIAELTEVITDAWLAQAPKRLAQAYLEGLSQGR